MQKYRFVEDYGEGCHPKILEVLASSNTHQLDPYGDDAYSDDARHKILAQLGGVSAAVHFIASGTLANIVIAASALGSHESIIAADTGHIVVGEAGAIETIGRQIITLPTNDGKLTPDGITAALAASRQSPFATKPRAVYISNTTELGTVYNKSELEAIAECCRSNNLLLWLDGARLAAAIAGPRDLTLAEVAEYCDVFWIGGTKSGAMFGEAIVVPNKTIAEDIHVHIKQRGALLSKGRFLGAQFSVLFQDRLIFDLASHACQMAAGLAAALENSGYSLYASNDANLVFATLPNGVVARLSEDFEIYVWKSLTEGESVVRLATSWATPIAQIERFKKICNQVTARCV